MAGDAAIDFATDGGEDAGAPGLLPELRPEPEDDGEPPALFVEELVGASAAATVFGWSRRVL